MNPGGPGASGVRRVARGFQITPEVADRFDIVGFDPRGVGESTPITCGDTVPAFRAADLAPDTPEEEAAPRGGGPGRRRRVRRHRGRPPRPLRERGGRPRHRGDPARPRRGPDQLRRDLLRHAARAALGGVVPRRRCGRWCSTAWSSPRPRAVPAAPSRRPAAVERVVRRHRRGVRRRSRRARSTDDGRARRPPTTSWPGGSRPATVQRQRRRADPARLRGVLGDLRPGDLAAPLGRGGERARRRPVRHRRPGRLVHAPGDLRAVRHRVLPRRPPPGGLRRVAGGLGRATSSGRRGSGRSSPTSCSPARSGPRAPSSRRPSTRRAPHRSSWWGAPATPPRRTRPPVAVADAARVGRAAHRRARRARGHRRLRLRRRRHHPLPRRPRPSPPPAPAADFAPAATAPLLSDASDRAHGGSPAMEFNLADLHDAVSDAIGDRECIVWRDRRLTYAEVADRTNRLANHLIGAGLGRPRRARPTSPGTRAGRTTSRATSTTATSTSRRCSAPTRPGWRRST